MSGEAQYDEVVVKTLLADLARATWFHTPSTALR